MRESKNVGAEAAAEILLALSGHEIRPEWVTSDLLLWVRNALDGFHSSDAHNVLHVRLGEKGN